jgi:metal-responsive CopG/Arc/MetJ family transcriptional regulator
MTTNRVIPPARAAKLQRLLTSRSKKTKVSISISADLVAAADELAGKSHRSELFERGVRSLMRRLVRRARDERELALLDKHAESLNAAASESLEFQSDLDGE